MMFIINRHSFVDVITNSSSELFVFDSKKSLDMIREVLSEVLTSFLRITTEKFNEKTFDEMFKTLEIIGEKNIDGVIKYALDFEHHHLFYPIAEKPPKYDDFKDKNDENLSDSFHAAYDRYEKAQKEWMARHRAELLEQLKGKILMISTRDNSIPYPIIEFIDATFGGERIHLG